MHLALLQTSVTWLKPKAITPISASAGATRPSRCEPRDCTRTILSWQARSIEYSLAQMTLPIVSEMGTPAPLRPQAIVLSRFSAGRLSRGAPHREILRMRGFSTFGSDLRSRCCENTPTIAKILSRKLEISTRDKRDRHRFAAISLGSNGH